MWVNGAEVVLLGECALKAFLDREGYDASRVAVERNGEIVPKNAFEAVTLSDKDRLEIVAFIGGG